MLDSVLEIRAAHKRYGATVALAGADLTLRRCEWLGLLGPNGAGKTTLIRAVSGRVRLDGGEMSILGARLDGDPAALAAARRRLGLVPQDVALYPLLTARENLRAWGALHGLDGAELNGRVDRALEWTGLAERSRERVDTFSGGMKRRLNIACGVLHEPEVVLLDEPTVGVDPQSRQRIWEMLGHLRDRGTSLLLTTHQLDEAQQVCDRITIIDHGRAIADGTFDQLVAKTIGSGRLVTMTVDREPDGRIMGEDLQASGPRNLSKRVESVAAELPALFRRIDDAGLRVEDVKIEAPSLQAVFIHLTGRELRE